MNRSVGKMNSEILMLFLFMINVTVLGILVLSGVVLLPVLLPIAATDDSVNKNEHTSNTTSNVSFSDLDKLSMANIEVSYVTFS